MDLENDKINQICLVLRQKTLEPAELEAAKILEDARLEANALIEQAKAECAKMRQDVEVEVVKEKQRLESSLRKATELSLETLRQEIEKALFNPALESLIAKPLQDPQMIARMIEALVQAAGKEGTVQGVIPKEISPEEVVKHLCEEVRRRLTSETVAIGNFKGGAQLRLVDKRMVLEMSDSSLKDLVMTFVGSHFRKFFFQS